MIHLNLFKNLLKLKGALDQVLATKAASLNEKQKLKGLKPRGLDFLKPKTRINEKVGNKMRSAEPKTQLFKKSCILGSGKIHVQNELHLWTSEVHK